MVLTKHNLVLWVLLAVSIVLVLVLRLSSSPGITTIDYVAISVGAIAVWGYFAFVLFAIRSNSLPIQREQAGDNAYYIGLLLTFVSLAAALVKLVVEIQENSSFATTVQSESRTQISQLIPDFGIALVSTICGIAARMILQQQISGLPETQEETQKSLEQASRAFERSLTVSTGAIHTAVRSISHGVADQLQDAKLHVEEFAQVSDELHKLGKEYLKSTKFLLDRVETTHDAISTELETLTKAKLGENFQALSIQVKETQAVLAQIRHEIAVSGKVARSVINEIEGFSDKLRSVVPVTGTNTLHEALDEATQRSREFGRDLISAQARIQSTKGNLDALENQSDSILDASLNLNDGIERVSSQLKSVESNAIEANQKITASTKGVGKIETSIESATTDVATTIADIRNAVTSYRDKFQRSINDLDSFSLEFDELRDEVKKRRSVLRRLFSRRKKTA